MAAIGTTSVTANFTVTVALDSGRATVFTADIDVKIPIDVKASATVARAVLTIDDHAARSAIAGAMHEAAEALEGNRDA